jgi:hypothetical protein
MIVRCRYARILDGPHKLTFGGLRFRKFGLDKQRLPRYCLGATSITRFA